MQTPDAIKEKALVSRENALALREGTARRAGMVFNNKCHELAFDLGLVTHSGNKKPGFKLLEMHMQALVEEHQRCERLKRAASHELDEFKVAQLSTPTAAGGAPACTASPRHLGSALDAAMVAMLDETEGPTSGSGSASSSGSATSTGTGTGGSCSIVETQNRGLPYTHIVPGADSASGTATGAGAGASAGEGSDGFLSGPPGEQQWHKTYEVEQGNGKSSYSQL